MPPQRHPINPEWKRSLDYHNEHLIRPDAGLAHALAETAAHGMPSINVSPAQGKLLKLVAQSMKAKRVLEVGTLGEYSTIWLAQALPADGSLLTCEYSEKHAVVARANLADAGFKEPQVEVRVGPALDTLRALHADMPFDLMFVDADKTSNTEYVKEGKRLVRSGGVIIVDNVGQNGRVADPTAEDDPHRQKNLEGVRELLRYLKEDDELDATTIHTLGEGRYDGFLFCVRR